MCFFPNIKEVRLRKILKFILSLVFFVFIVRIHAYQLYYSEWSENYPENIGNKIVQHEDRYLWYKEVIKDEQYLVKEEIGDRLVDYDDFIYSERIDNGFEKPKSLKDRVIEVEPKERYYNNNELSGIIIQNLSNDSYIAEIEIIDKNTNNKIGIKDTTEQVLLDSILNNYTNINNKVYINFKDYKSIDDLDIKLYCSPGVNSYIEFTLVTKEGFHAYVGRYRFNNEILEIEKENLTEYTHRSENNYFYIDKLYKTYIIEQEITDEYLKNCSGCTRIDDSKKTFYRYIKNDYVIIDTFGNVVDGDDACLKNFCMIEYLEYKEEKPKEKVVKVNNPKTYDGVDKYIILSIISTLLIIMFMFHKKIFLVLSNRFKLRSNSSTI